LGIELGVIPSDGNINGQRLGCVQLRQENAEPQTPKTTSTILTWVAYYEDGNIIRQGSIDYGNLTQKGLRVFSLVDGSQTVATVEPQSDERVFYRRRVFNATMPNQFYMYLLGIRSKAGVQLQIIMPDGKIIHDTQFRNQWYEPQWTEAEQV